MDNLRIISLCGFIFLSLSFKFLMAIETDSTKIENLNFSLIGEKIYIEYDIVNYSGKDKFYITLEVLNLKNKNYYPISLDGDVNKFVQGGPSKTIIWEVKKDYPDFNDSIYVKITATKYAFSAMQDLVLAPTIFPGYSLYKQKDKKPWLLLGAAGYASLISAIVLKQVAISTYNNYENELSIDKRDKYFTNANNYRILSNCFFYTSIGIWAVNYTLTYFLITKKYRYSTQDNNTVISLQRGIKSDISIKFNLAFNF